MSNKYFDIHSITETPKAQVEGVFSKYLNKHLQRIETYQNCAEYQMMAKFFSYKQKKPSMRLRLFPGLPKSFLLKKSMPVRILSLVEW